MKLAEKQSARDDIRDEESEFNHCSRSIRELCERLRTTPSTIGRTLRGASLRWLSGRRTLARSNSRGPGRLSVRSREASS